MTKGIYLNNCDNNKRKTMVNLIRFLSGVDRENRKKQNKEIIDFMKCLKEAQDEWINANSNFEYADDKDKVDYYTFHIKACQLRYEYLLKKARQMNISLKKLKTINNI
jgi:hypothetical protein